MEIEKVQVGDRTLGRNPIREQVDPDAPEPDPNTWRKLVIRMTKESGRELRINLLRPQKWIEAAKATAGGSFFLNLPEMGAVGVAHVDAIEPCPPVKRGRGNVVTGTFHHEADPDKKILRVEFSDGTILKGVTDNHPFWSEDRQGFVPVGELRKGDRVRVNGGLAAVASVSSRLPYPGEMLYNLEVHNEHVYQVTTAGILVHNSCGPNPIDPNKLNHVFGDAGHNLGGLVGQFGSEAAAYNAVEAAAAAAVRQQGINGVFQTVVTVGGQQVTVRGIVINGLMRIGTFFIP